MTVIYEFQSTNKPKSTQLTQRLTQQRMFNEDNVSGCQMNILYFFTQLQILRQPFHSYFYVETLLNFIACGEMLLLGQHFLISYVLQ